MRKMGIRKSGGRCVTYGIPLLQGLAGMSALCVNMTVAPAISDQGQRVSVWGRMLEVYPRDALPVLLIFLGAVAYFYRWRMKRLEQKLQFRPEIAVVSALFGLNIAIGKSFLEYENFTLLIADGFQFLFTAFLILGYAMLFYVLLYRGFLWAVQQETGAVCTDDGQPGRACGRRENRRNGWLCFGILFLCYLPWLFAFYPGSINSDTLHQMCMYFGYVEWTNHYPVFSTWLIGSCMQLGKLCGSDNLGAFFYALLQTAALCGAFALTLQKMREWGIRRKWRLFVLAFYGLTPFFGGYAQFLIKDTLYSACVLLFVTLLADCMRSEADFAERGRRAVLLGAVGVLMALLRNNGIYVAIPGVLGLLAFFGSVRARKRSAAVLVGIAALYLLWGHVLLPIWGIPQGSVKEALSIPFQQTARYVKQYGDEVTPQEKASINKVLDYDALPTVYTTYGSDPVKNTYKEPAAGQPSQLPQYFATWFRMFLKHPGVYLEATVSNSYYYYSGAIHTTLEPVFLENITQNEHTGYFQLEQPAEKAGQRAALGAVSALLNQTPVVGILYSEGLYTNLLLTMAAYLLYRHRKRSLAVLLPSAFCILICIASPINGSFRYFLPVIVQTPVLSAFVLTMVQKKEALPQAK